MYVSFKANENVNGFKILSRNGLTQYIAKKDNIIICFITDAGSGKNYSKILWYTDTKKNRCYKAQRYLYKYVSTVQGLSNVLFQRYLINNRSA